MADAKESKRLEALTVWAQRSAAAGIPAPGANELASIAAHPTNWTERVASPVLAAWAPTIDHLLHQIKFGVSPVTAVDQLPDELTLPSSDLPAPEPESVPAEPPPPATESGLEPDEAPSTDGPSQIVEALMRWRGARIAEGAEGADLIKDVTLRNLVKFGHSDGHQIGKKLPGPAAYLGREIAAVIAEFTDPDSRAPAPPAADDPPEQSAPPQPAALTPPPAPTPTVRPTAEPQRPAPRQDRTEGVLLNLTHSDFCDYEYGDSEIAPGPVTIKATADGLRLAFEPYLPEAGKMVIYRVVSGDDSEPFKPEAGDLVAVTTALQVHDNRYLSCAVRNYQVWCHVGIDHEDARHNQPFLLAIGEEVSPVDDFVVSEDEGRVIGRWTTFPGTRAVRVFRIPLEGSAPVRDDPRNQISADKPNLTGFVDTQVTRGMRYLYRALAEVTVGSSVRLSRPRQQEVLVSVDLVGVEDLEVISAEDNSRFDLAWTTPEAGHVRVYRVSTPPPPGLEGSEMPEAALQVQGFTDETLIKDPVVPADATHSRIAGVPWPAAWERAYLTPVTVLGGNARIGTTKIKTRPVPPVTDAEIIERFDTEIVTFGWPTGAAAMLAYVGSTTLSPEEICDRSQPLAEMSAAEYRRDGGLILPRPLEPKGCTVCLVPVAYSRGEQVRGEITALHYPGLHRLRYDLVPQQIPSRYIMEIKIESNLDIESPIGFVMRKRLDRFPLSPKDGELVYLLPPEGGEPLPQWVLSNLPRGEHLTGCRVDWTNHRGFFRLFVSSQADPNKRYALADTSLHRLWFNPAIGAPE
ncbi:hypothetical protein ACGFK1_04725 [Mycobacterium sp. NPDC048908]|uniref:hypothetical protein n=1 Tax=Mycobacterium sp. NPDC048908 TaxID=3364292 RepID=UPI003716DF98